MDTFSKSSLSWILIGSLLFAGGCASNLGEPEKPAPSTQAQPPETALPSNKPASEPTAAQKPVTLHPAKTKVKAEPKAASPMVIPEVKGQKPIPEPVKTPLPVVTEQPSPAPVAPAVESIPVAVDKMPIKIHDQWVVDRNESHCILKSIPVQMDDGQGGTRVTFWLTPGLLQFKTNSDIDLSYQGTGIQVDGGRSFVLESVEHRTNPQIIKQRQALLDSMQNGRSLRLTLGFWPTWPVTHTYEVTIPLTSFGTAFKTWETCNQLLKTK
jgi:hypothetical protein